MASPEAFFGYLTKYLPPRHDFFQIDAFLFEPYFFQNGDGENATSKKGPPAPRQGTIKLGPFKMRFEKIKLFFQTLVFFDINSKKKLLPQELF